ncbi:hypothetical protein ACFWA6_25460 [Streptomyces sp. NPDC060020]|uniref:hypothetical protein n=1 Tax=Streptomyces sp. NPDC060020 TaxID=3347038 RepID=UPI003697CF32
MDLGTSVGIVRGWLEANAPGDFGRLNPPAHRAEIQNISVNRFGLHADLRELLMLHNGVRADRGLTGPGGFLPGGYFLLGAEDMRSGQRDMEKAVAWSVEDDLVDFVVGGVAHVRWVPIAETHVGSQLVVDHREGPDYGAVREIDASAEVWGIKRWDGLAEMFDATYRALADGTPVIDVVDEEIRAHLTETPDGVVHVEWK